MDDDKPKDEPEHDGRARAPAPPHEGRRGTLGLLVAVGSAAYGAIVAAPAVRLAMAEGGAAEPAARWLPVARLDALTAGKPARVEVRDDARDAFSVTRAELLGAVWLVREGDAVRALSATCPHLGCAVDLADAAAPAEGFACPCHTSRFALDGASRSGPSPRGMDPLEARVVDGVVEVEFRRFRQGVARREEVRA